VTVRVAVILLRVMMRVMLVAAFVSHDRSLSPGARRPAYQDLRVCEYAQMAV